MIATQNPTQQSGVFILPESQLDRFLMCLSLGYPSVNAERELLLGKDRRQMLSQITPMLDTQSLQQAQAQAKEVYIADVVIDYLQRLVAKTRESRDYHGLSTRGVLALKQAAQAFAYLGGYNEVTPEDIKRYLLPLSIIAWGKLLSHLIIWAVSSPNRLRPSCYAKCQ